MSTSPKGLTAKSCGSAVRQLCTIPTLLRGHLSCAALDVPPQGAVDIGLIAAAALGASLEPSNDVRVEPQRDLLLDRTIEDVAARAHPARNFEAVNLVVGRFQEGFKRSPALFVELRVAGRG